MSCRCDGQINSAGCACFKARSFKLSKKCIIDPPSFISFCLPILRYRVTKVKSRISLTTGQKGHVSIIKVFVRKYDLSVQSTKIGCARRKWKIPKQKRDLKWSFYASSVDNIPDELQFFMGTQPPTHTTPTPTHSPPTSPPPHASTNTKNKQAHIEQWITLLSAAWAAGVGALLGPKSFPLTEAVTVLPE